MHIAARWASSTLTLELTPDDGEPLQEGSVRLIGREAHFGLPVPIGPDDVHPDVEALLCLLVAGPYSSAIRVDRAVSTAFAEAVATSLGKPVTPVDPALAPRRPPADGIIGLAFSGGADSTAALEVLPDTTVACFMRRIDPPGAARRSIYSDAAALHACAELERRGRQVRIVEADVEHVRDPLGFTTPWVNGAGLLLLADVERFNALAWGVVAESTYHVGHAIYEDWAVRQIPWGTAFAAVGLPMCHATAGVSEIGTTAIVRASRYASVAQSCIRGEPGVPCNRCWKCFRKSLLDAAQTGDWPENHAVDGMLASKEVRSKLSEYPIKHENVVAWTMARYQGDHPVLRLLARRTRGSELALDWLTRYYPPSIGILPEAWRAETRARLEARLAPMTGEEEERMRAWNMAPILEDPATIAARDALVAALESYAPPNPARTRRPVSARIMRRVRRYLPI